MGREGEGRGELHTQLPSRYFTENCISLGNNKG